MFVQRLSYACLAATLLAAAVLGQGRSARAVDLSQYVSPEFCGVIVIHPQRIGKSTLGEAIKSGLPKSLTSADPAEAIAGALKNAKDRPQGMDPDKLAKLLAGKPVQRFVVMADSELDGNTPKGAMLVQFAADIDGEGIIAALTTESQPAETNGVKYTKLKGTKPGEADGAAAAPDSRTLILGVETTVKKMLAKNEGDRPLLNQLQHASFDNDVVIEYYAPTMWEGLTKSTGKSVDEIMAATTGKNPAVADMVKDLKSVSIRINFSGKTLLRGEVGSGKTQTANMLAMIGQQQVTNGKTQFEALKKNPPPGPAALVMPMLTKVGDEVFQGLEIKAEGTQMTVDLPMPDSLPGALTAAAQMFGPFIPVPKGGGQ